MRDKNYDEAQEAVVKIRKGLDALGVRWSHPVGAPPHSMRTIIPLEQSEEDGTPDCSFFALHLEHTAKGVTVSVDIRANTWQTCDVKRKGKG